MVYIVKVVRFDKIWIFWIGFDFFRCVWKLLFYRNRLFMANSRWLRASCHCWMRHCHQAGGRGRRKDAVDFAALSCRGAGAGRALSESSSKIVTKAGVLFFFIFPWFFRDARWQRWQPAVAVWQCGYVWLSMLSTAQRLVSGLSSPGNLHVAEDLRRGRRQKWGDGPWWPWWQWWQWWQWAVSPRASLFSGPKVELISVDKCS